ncbi:hypothetical protein V3C99_006486, partial [Haemonchus contortus]
YSKAPDEDHASPRQAWAAFLGMRAFVSFMEPMYLPSGSRTSRRLGE